MSIDIFKPYLPLTNCTQTERKLHYFWWNIVINCEHYNTAKIILFKLIARPAFLDYVVAIAFCATAVDHCKRTPYTRDAGKQSRQTIPCQTMITREQWQLWLISVPLLFRKLESLWSRDLATWLIVGLPNIHHVATRKLIYEKKDCIKSCYT